MTAGPSAPPSAREVFGDRLPVLETYAGLLAGAGIERGLLGPREAPRLWERHLLNCAGLSELVADGETVLDLGSGAGLPGLVLAAMRPEVTVVLCEPLLRRATFLSEAVTALGVSAVVRRARAEELAGKVLVDAVTSRAVAPLDKLAGWSLPLVREGGRLLALKGERADEEVAALRGGLRGATGVRVVEVGSAEQGTLSRVVVAERDATTLGAGRAGPAKPVLRGSTTARSRRRPS